MAQQVQPQLPADYNPTADSDLSLSLNYWERVCSHLNFFAVVRHRGGGNWSVMNRTIGRNHHFLQRALAHGDLRLSVAMCTTLVSGFNIIRYLLEMLPISMQETNLSLARKAEVEALNQAMAEKEKELAAEKEKNAQLTKANADLQNLVTIALKR